MPTLDLTPKSLDLVLYIGDDPRLQLTFYVDDTETERVPLDGYTGWAATIRTAAGETATFAIDDSEQANSVITLQLEGNDVRGFQTRGSRWDIRVLDPDGREVTLMRGRVIFREDVTL